MPQLTHNPSIPLFFYCQVHPPPPDAPDLVAADKRIAEVLTVKFDSAYNKKKLKLWYSWAGFLKRFSATPLTATPHLLLRFLALRDCNGKTRVHSPDCPQIGLKVQSCLCPKRLAASTVANIVSRLNARYRTVFGEHFKPPGDTPLVKAYLDGVLLEQARGRVMVKQAVPMLFEKLYLILCFLHRKLSSDLSRGERFNTLRDIAFLSMQFFGGDRVSDLAETYTQDLKILPSVGLRVTHFVGKVLRGKSKNTFTLPVVAERLACPVRALKSYVDGAKSMGINLSTGYLFRHANRRGLVPKTRVQYSHLAPCLKGVLQSLCLDQGETPHSLRAGCALSLMASKTSALEIMSHVGWATPKMLHYYARTDACRSSAIAAKLALPGVVAASKVALKACSFLELPHAFT